MKRLFVSIPVLAALALPAAAQADTTKTDKTNAAKECRSERGSNPATQEAFKARYGTRSNAFGKCVSKRSKSEATQRKSAASNAAKDCKTERSADPDAFKTRYGTNKNGNNAYGKCVSQKAKAKKDATDKADALAIAKRKSAAKTCATERKADADAFKAKYGTNRTKSNAFGKCVSATAKKKSES